MLDVWRLQGKEETWPGQYSNESCNNLKKSPFYCLGHLYLKLFQYVKFLSINLKKPFLKFSFASKCMKSTVICVIYKQL